MSGLNPDEQVRNAVQQEPWKKSERDRLLDLYFSGAHPKRIATILQRNSKATIRKLQEYICNERDRALNYVPFRRASRKGKRITENERAVMVTHKGKGMPIEVTARLLMRDVSEINDDWKKVAQIKASKVFAPTLDFILALRYVYHVYHQSIVSDKTYDDLVAEEIEFGGGEKVLKDMKEPQDCPPRIKSLAFYLCDKFKEGTL